MTEPKPKKSWLKKLLIVGLVLFLIGALAIWYIFSEKFKDTSEELAAYSISSNSLIKEFQDNDPKANEKYAEKIITVTGIVAEKEAADTTINIKMVDSLTDSYVIFAFQQQHLKEATQLKEGEKVSIKGSCSGGTYSKILEAEYIAFKRCAVVK